MKKSDIALLIFIAGSSVLVAYVVARMVFGDVYNGSATVKTVEKINTVVQDPDPEIFNKDAINPAVKVNIEERAQE